VEWAMRTKVLLGVTAVLAVGWLAVVSGRPVSDPPPSAAPPKAIEAKPIEHGPPRLTGRWQYTYTYPDGSGRDRYGLEVIDQKRLVWTEEKRGVGRSGQGYSSRWEAAYAVY